MPVLSTEAAVAYHELLQGTPGLLESTKEQLLQRLADVRFVFGGRMLSPYLRPCFIRRGQFDQISAVCQSIWSSVSKVGQLAIHDVELQNYLGLTEVERQLVAIDPGFSGLSRLARFDSFLTERQYQFVELNAETPAGVAYADVASEIFEELPAMKQFHQRFRTSQLHGRRHLLETLLSAYREYSNSSKTPPQIAIVDYRGLPTQREFELVQEYFEARGYRTIIADPRELEFSGGRLRKGDFAIDLVYKRILVNEFLEKLDDCRAFYDAYKARAVCVVNSFRGKLIHKKFLFAALTDEKYAHLFTADERRQIDRHVPWTRRVERRRTAFEQQNVDLLDFIRDNRERLVLKPNDDYGGKGIFIGWQSDQSQWDEALEIALSGDYLVQDKVTSSREVFPYVNDERQVSFHEQLVDLDPMIFDGNVGCAFARLSNTELANVTAGGGMVPVFIVENDR